MNLTIPGTCVQNYQLVSHALNLLAVYFVWLGVVS
jgi:hypothetical protein